jgi:hypothetical protein
MYPDATTSAVQFGQPSPRAQGAFMNWRSWSSEAASCLSMFLLLWGWDYLNGKTPHFGPQDYIGLLIAGAALSMGGVGLKELDRNGYRRVKHKLLGFFIVLLVLQFSLVIFSRNLLHRQVAGLDFNHLYFFAPFFVLWAAIFPLSLYLDRKKNKSLSQTAVPNAG